MPNPKTRRTGHQAALIRRLRNTGTFLWADFAPYTGTGKGFRDSVYKAVERLRKRGWKIRPIVGGYRLQEEGD